MATAVPHRFHGAVPRRSRVCSSPRLFWGAALAAALVIALWSPPAGHACSSAPTQSEPFPARDAIDVARDTLILIEDFRSPLAPRTPAPNVAFATGEPVAVEEVTMPGLVLAQAYRPLTLLPPDTDVLVDGIRRFRTGTTASSAASDWTFVETRYSVSDDGCLAGSSCGRSEHFVLVLRGEPTPTRPLFHLFVGNAQGTFDVESPVFAFMTGYDIGGGLREFYLNRVPFVDFGVRVFVVPVSPSGRVLGKPVGPIFIERDTGGCSIAPGGSRRVLLLGIVLLLLWVVLRWGGHRSRVRSENPRESMATVGDVAEPTRARSRRRRRSAGRWS